MLSSMNQKLLIYGLRCYDSRELGCYSHTHGQDCLAATPSGQVVWWSKVGKGGKPLSLKNQPIFISVPYVFCCLELKSRDHTQLQDGWEI